MSHVDIWPSSGIGEVGGRGKSREVWSRQKIQQEQSSEVKEYSGFTFTVYSRKAMMSVWLG